MAHIVNRIRNRGFTLIEMMIALVIMAIIGVMAWRGLDSLMRGKERIESHSSLQRDIHYALTLLDRDCRLMVSQTDLDLPPVALGNRSIWWMRQSSSANRPGWQMVGYRVQREGLVRMLSGPFSSKDKALEVWKAQLVSPDNDNSQLELQHLTEYITTQTVTILSDAPNKVNPIRGIKFVWQVSGNQPNDGRPITRVCLGGGF